MIEAYPLQWPLGYERTAAGKMRYSQFKSTLGQARDGVMAEIYRLGGKNPVISSNIPIKKNGELYASLKPVDGDHGVAVYFTYQNEQMVLACDAYHTIWENLRAIEKSIEAMRGLERWGASDILKRAFTGFKALPEQAGGTAGAAWWKILRVEQTATAAEIKTAWREMSKYFHPDNQATGNREMFEMVQKAYNEAQSQKTNL